MPFAFVCMLNLQVTGGYPQQQMTGGMRPPSPYGAPSPAAAAAAGPTGPYTPQATGYMPGGAGPTGGMPAAAGVTGAGVAGLAGGAASLPGFPPVTLADMQRYQATFAAVDTDRDGFAKVRVGGGKHSQHSDMQDCLW
jgi:hypothetical protein